MYLTDEHVSILMACIISSFTCCRCCIPPRSTGCSRCRRREISNCPGPVWGHSDYNLFTYICTIVRKSQITAVFFPVSPFHQQIFFVYPVFADFPEIDFHSFHDLIFTNLDFHVVTIFSHSVSRIFPKNFLVAFGYTAPQRPQHY